MNEYLCTLDVKEVKQCLAEYGQKDNSPFVKECLNIVIEASPREAQKLVTDLSKLYSFLKKESSIRSVDLEKGFKSILVKMVFDDMVIDIPQFPKFLGFFIAALISVDVIDLNMPVKQFLTDFQQYQEKWNGTKILNTHAMDVSASPLQHFARRQYAALAPKYGPYAS